VFLVRVAGSRAERTLTIHRVGDVVRVGDLSVIVTRVTERADAVQIGVEIDARAARLAQPADAERPWSLLVRTPRARREATGDRPCKGQEIAAGATLACDVAFEPGEGAAFLSFDFLGSGARWRLD
jgi:hypothetical protein